MSYRGRPRKPRPENRVRYVIRGFAFWWHPALPPTGTTRIPENVPNQGTGFRSFLLGRVQRAPTPPPPRKK